VQSFSVAKRTTADLLLRDIPLVLLAYGGYKLVRRTKVTPLEAVPIRQALEEAENDPENVPIVKGNSIWSKLNILWG
jgi:amino acid transporter